MIPSDRMSPSKVFASRRMRPALKLVVMRVVSTPSSVSVPAIRRSVSQRGGEMPNCSSVRVSPLRPFEEDFTSRLRIVAGSA